MQKNIDRDTCKFAFKASNMVVNGISEGIAKNPISDPGKKSKRGRLALIKQNDVFKTVRVLDAFYPHPGDHLRDVYVGGDLLVDEDLDTIRKRIK
jgi:nicotinamide phosphoribosyltransferase